jgi:hypothetical protein
MWLERAAATRDKKRQKNALWLLKRAAAARETKRPVAGHSGNCLKSWFKKAHLRSPLKKQSQTPKKVKKSPFKVVVIMRKVKLR